MASSMSDGTNGIANVSGCPFFTIERLPLTSRQHGQQGTLGFPGQLIFLSRIIYLSKAPANSARLQPALGRPGTSRSKLGFTAFFLAPIAKLVPHMAGKTADPEWAAAYRRMMARLEEGAALGGLRVEREKL